MKTIALSKRQKLPSIWWHTVKKQFVCKIGYKRVKRDEQWQRVKAFQTLGRDEVVAMDRAIALQVDWDWTVDFFKTSIPYVGQKPYWLPDQHRELYRLAEAGEQNKMQARMLETGLHLQLVAPEDDPDYIAQLEQLEAGGRDRITLAGARDLFLDHYRNRIGLAAGKGINEYTFRHYENNLKQVFRYLDADLLLKELTRADIEQVINAFMRLPGNISVRSAVNYCKAFKQMLDWLADEETVHFNKPKGMDRLFRFKNYNPIRIEPYSNEELKAIFDAMPGKFQLYPQLAINCGYYQIDIATLSYEHLVTFDNGREVGVKHLADFTGDLFIRRRRQKTLHQNDFQTLCYVWPENVALLKTHAAPSDNPYGLVLLNEQGLPLVRGKINNITDRFNKYKKNAGLGRSIEFKQFRKTGATWMEQHHGDRVARMYSAHALNGELKRYVAQDFEPLTAALKAWRQELILAGVLT